MLSMVLLFLGWLEVTLIIVAVIFFFGAKRIPALAGSIGKAIGEFKRGKDEPGAGTDTTHNQKP